jgi:hypothetical protein
MAACMAADSSVHHGSTAKHPVGLVLTCPSCWHLLCYVTQGSRCSSPLQITVPNAAVRFKMLKHICRRHCDDVAAAPCADRRWFRQLRPSMQGRHLCR